MITLVSAAVGLAAPVALIAFAGARDQAERSATWTQTYALVALLAVAPVLALLSLRRRAALLPAAAAAGVAVSIVGVTFAPVLWLPSLGYLFAYSRAPTPPAPARRREPVTIVLVLLLAIAGVGALFVDTETVCWRYVEFRSGERTSSRPAAAECHQGTFSASGSVGSGIVASGGGSASVPTLPGFAVALGTCVLAVAASWTLSGRRPRS